MEKMTPEGAMGQASSTAIVYFNDCYKFLKGSFPKASEEVKMRCAAQMALAASIDYATAQIGGKISSQGESHGVDVHIHGSLDEDE